ncbi:hypothetical protein C4D60_Mb06t02370 [Musa balbisiana]|uniref:Uncharacterized protein n=1 Tax=Musa balbisiana TaxID=52838 RepID=A0A4V4H3M0_MUSBA|nr:hypothetical protein C4D60_Mb06t02370 [Musa balbisiana]
MSLGNERLRQRGEEDSEGFETTCRLDEGHPPEGASRGSSARGRFPGLGSMVEGAAPSLKKEK